MGEAADHQERPVGEQRDEREQRGGRDDHEQVVGREGASLRDGLAKLTAIGEEHLVETLDPATALLDGGGEGQWLLIEELSWRVADLNAMDGAEGRELDILGERVEVPAVHGLHDLGGDQVARTGDGAGGAAEHARVVEEAGLAEEPDGVGSANPRASEVLGVAIAREREISLVEGIVHDGHVIRRQQVVGVEDDERLVLARILVEDAVEAVIHHPALALARQVVALVDDGSGLAGTRRRLIRAGICDNEDIDEFGRIVLCLDGLHQVGDHGFLVVRRDEERVRMLLLCLGDLHLVAHVADDKEDELVEEAHRKEHGDDEVEDLDGCHGSVLPCCRNETSGECSAC